MKPATYRYPGENSTLYSTLFLVFLVIAITSTATFFTSALFVALAVAITYALNRAHHEDLISHAVVVNPQTLPELNNLVTACAKRLNVSNYEVYVARNHQLNAYTFGIHDQKVVVLYSSLLGIMDRDELAFIIGHELGHIALGHTKLNSLMGGMAGIPSAGFTSAILNFALLGWNRACEFSADRAGMLVNQKPEKAISALVKLVAGKSSLTKQDFLQAYRQIDAEDDSWLGNFSEVFASHPLLIRRIKQIQSYSRSAVYQRYITKERA